MPLCINQIICASKIIYKTDPKNITWTKNRFKILNNSITVTWFNYNFHICKNIKILFKNNLHNIIKKEIQWFTGESVKKLEVRVTNIQHSGSLNYNKTDLLREFLPQLNTEFPIHTIEITQEQHASTKIKLETILKDCNIPYLCLNLKVLNQKVTIKLQLNKNKTLTHTTVIVSTFSSDVASLMSFLDTKQHD